MKSRVQIQTEAIWYSFGTPDVNKGMNPPILFLVMDTIVEETMSLSFGVATSMAEGKFWTQAGNTPPKK